MGSERTTSTTMRTWADPDSPTAITRSAEAAWGEPPDLVSIYAERLRAAEHAPPLFVPRPVLRVGRGRAVDGRRPSVVLGSALRGMVAPSHLTRRRRLVAGAAAVAAVVTTALAGAGLVG